MSEVIDIKNEIEVSEIMEKSDNSEKYQSFVKTDEEKRLKRKIDRIFAPFVVVILFTQFIDKTTINNAAALTLFEDTGITHDQFSWLGSIFYVGYLCMQPFNNVFMHKFPISKYLGVVMCIWGICLACMSEASNFSQLAALRFLLGFFEAVTYPTIFLLIATFYRRSEQVYWFGITYISNSLGVILGGLIGYGIGFMPTVGHITPWKWNMIIFGCFTVLLGIIFFFFLPDHPYSRWFALTNREKEIVEDRIRDNAVIPTFKLNYDQIKEALSEPRFYCYCLVILLVNLQNGALTIYGALLIKNLGFSSLNAILLTIPSGFINSFFIAFFSYLSKRYNETLYNAAAACVLSVIGFILLAALPNGGVCLLGYYLSWGCATTFPLTQASIAANSSGYTKKIFYTGAGLVAYTIGNFIGPFMLVSHQAPRYIGGICGFLGANVLAIILLLYIRYDLVSLNKKRGADPKNSEKTLVDELDDITDVQNQYFVYTT